MTTATTTRGTQSIFQKLIFEEDAQTPSLFGKTKGRDAQLIEARNKLLIHRYYYYAKILNLNYFKILETLENEFFIAQRTMSNILMSCDAQLFALKRQAPTVKYFKEMYPFMVW
jgi:hypothetical protein